MTARGLASNFHLQFQVNGFTGVGEQGNYTLINFQGMILFSISILINYRARTSRIFDEISPSNKLYGKRVRVLIPRSVYSNTLKNYLKKNLIKNTNRNILQQIKAVQCVPLTRKSLNMNCSRISPKSRTHRKTLQINSKIFRKFIL